VDKSASVIHLGHLASKQQNAPIQWLRFYPLLWNCFTPFFWLMQRMQVRLQWRVVEHSCWEAKLKDFPSLSSYIQINFDTLWLVSIMNLSLQLPSGSDMFSYYYDFDTKRFDLWERTVPSFKYSSETPFFDMLVPTIDTVRYGYLMDKLLAIKHSVLYTGIWVPLDWLTSDVSLTLTEFEIAGSTGVGKSVVARGLLESIAEEQSYVPMYMNFSAQTSSLRTQEFIESKLERKRKNIIGWFVCKIWLWCSLWLVSYWTLSAESQALIH